MARKKNRAAVALGRIKSNRKAAAARENGKKGGRPRVVVSGLTQISGSNDNDARPLIVATITGP